MLAEKFNNHFPNAKQYTKSEELSMGKLCSVLKLKRKKNCVPNQDQKGSNCYPEQLNIEIYNL